MQTIAKEQVSKWKMRMTGFHANESIHTKISTRLNSFIRYLEFFLNDPVQLDVEIERINKQFTFFQATVNVTTGERNFTISKVNMEPLRALNDAIDELYYGAVDGTLPSPNSKF